MTAQEDPLEQRLVHAYREQLRLYDQAVALTEHETAPGNHWIGGLDPILQAIAAVDKGITEDKSAWRQAGLQPGPEFSGLLDRIAGRLAMLAQIVQGQVAELEARKEQMLPEMDAFIQQRRMLSAYGTYGDRHAHVAKAN